MLLVYEHLEDDARVVVVTIQDARRLLGPDRAAAQLGRLLTAAQVLPPRATGVRLAHG